MEALSFEWLLAIGIILIGIEALILAFFLLTILVLVVMVTR